MRTYTTVTNPEFYDQIVKDAQAHETDWTINRHARPGDRVLLYVTAPISAIVAQAFIVETPRLEENPESPFVGLYFADMEGLEMLKTPITRDMLLRRFPDWRYWKQPRQSVEVHPMFVSSLDMILG